MVGLVAEAALGGSARLFAGTVGGDDPRSLGHHGRPHLGSVSSALIAKAPVPAVIATEGRTVPGAFVNPNSWVAGTGG
jgi:hypothetical protein